MCICMNICMCGVGVACKPVIKQNSGKMSAIGESESEITGVLYAILILETFLWL